MSSAKSRNSSGNENSMKSICSNNIPSLKEQLYTPNKDSIPDKGFNRMVFPYCSVELVVLTPYDCDDFKIHCADDVLLQIVAGDARPSKDIVVRLASFVELNSLQEKLVQKGIQVDPTAPITCRFTYDDVIIDVMATKEVGWAPSDPWFEPGFDSFVPWEIDEETTIQIFPLPYFLASKFSVFS